jgi:hypothetical protein
MRIIRIVLAVVLVSTLAVSCSKKKEMTMEDFVKIDLQITPTMEDVEIERITEKYGYTARQYKEFAEMVEKDPKLQEQRGMSDSKTKRKACNIHPRFRILAALPPRIRFRDSSFFTDRVIASI